MNPDFMRRVDKWVGIPLCFLFSLWNSLTRFFKKTKDIMPEKILFVELSEMGSAILAYSAMKKAKELYNSPLYFLIFKENADSVRLLNIIPEENIITIRSSSFLALVLDTFKALKTIRKLKIDTVIDLELFSRFTSLLSYLSGARRIAGFYKYHMEGLYRGNFLTHPVAYNPHYHISQSFMALVYAFKENLKDLPLTKRIIKKEEIEICKRDISEEAKLNIKIKLQEENKNLTGSSKIILLNPNSSQLLPIRKWPLNHYKQLIQKLLEEKNTFVVITGTKADKDDAQVLRNASGSKNIIDFTGKTTLFELIDLFAVADLLITNDSGQAHFATLTNIPVIVLFGPETPALYSPIGKNIYPFYKELACSPCVSAFNHRKTVCTNNVCLQKIEVEEVYDKAKELL